MLIIYKFFQMVRKLEVKTLFMIGGLKKMNPGVHNVDN